MKQLNSNYTTIYLSDFVVVMNVFIAPKSDFIVVVIIFVVGNYKLEMTT
jgi:hypothetical protein